MALRGSGKLFVCAVLAAGLAPGAAAAQQPVGPAGDIRFETYRLDNGLRVILAPDPQATAVAVNLWYDVGSRHERPGRSGFGHLFEHLMFQGSENVERGQHMQLVQRAGGSLNASITEDRTNYFQTVPPHQYNLALFLESDRMRSLRITAENMRREVEVVKEERRLRIDNAPYGTSQLQAFYYAAYDSTNCFPYAHSVIGSMEDLDAARLEDVQQFFDMYYAPNNATLTLVGNFDPAEARALIQENFGGSPGERSRRGAVHGAVPASPGAADGAGRQRAAPGALDQLRRSGGRNTGTATRSLLGSILGVGESSRLHQRLVRTDQLALQSQAFAVAAARAGDLPGARDREPGRPTWSGWSG
jgi:zinc protease